MENYTFINLSRAEKPQPVELVLQPKFVGQSLKREQIDFC